MTPALLESHREHYKRMLRGGRFVGGADWWAHDYSPEALNSYLEQFTPADREFIVGDKELPKRTPKGKQDLHLYRKLLTMVRSLDADKLRGLLDELI